MSNFILEFIKNVERESKEYETKKHELINELKIAQERNRKS